MKKRRMTVALGLAIAVPVLSVLWGMLAAAGAQIGMGGGFGEEEILKAEVSAYCSCAAAAAGDTVDVLLVLGMPPNFHVQINEFLDAYLPEPGAFHLQDTRILRTATWKEDTVLKDGSALLVRLGIREDAPPGPVSVEIALGYQGCMETPTFACFAPSEAKTSFDLEILPAGSEPRRANEDIFASYTASAGSGSSQTQPATLAEQNEPSTGGLSGKLEGALAKGSLLAFLLVFLGGILSSLTPCVYPMIPITISYVGGRARNKAEGFFLSLFFVLGLAVMYSALGLLAAATGTVFGSAMQSPIAMAVVAIVFTTMGASMLGAFDIALPSEVETKLSSSAMRGGIVGAVLMGMVTGLVAAPCVGPVLIVLLTYVGQTGNLFFGFTLLFTYAIGLGLLFLVLGTFAGALNALPGAGSWMESVKKGFGVVLMAMAIYYLRTIVGTQFARLLYAILLVATGIGAGALRPMGEARGTRVALGRTFAILALTAGLVVFVQWLAIALEVPKSLGLAATGIAAKPRTEAGIPWKINDEAALQQAKVEKRPVVQDFYADWCAACIELDEKTWIDPAVVEEAKRFVPVKMDFTKNDEFSKQARKRYRVVGMPTVIFYDSNGQEAARFSGFKPPGEVLEIMRSIH